VATASNPTRAVTLITGDTVTVASAADGSEIKRVQGPDGGPTGFLVNKAGTDTYVYPDSALPYVASGLLDKDLFNLTRLIADGYDNAHTDHLPLIVIYTDTAARSRTQPVPTGAPRSARSPASRAPRSPRFSIKVGAIHASSQWVMPATVYWAPGVFAGRARRLLDLRPGAEQAGSRPFRHLFAGPGPG
jgi:hypothetical protein